MSALADKLRELGNEQTLELEFRFQCLNLAPRVDHIVFLPKFREKGRVIMVDSSTGRVLEFTVRFLFLPMPYYLP